MTAQLQQNQFYSIGPRDPQFDTSHWQTKSIYYELL